MKKDILILFLVLSTAFANVRVVRADDPPVPDTSPTVASVKKGQVVPFDGTLLSPEAVATIIADKQASAETTSAETARVQSEEQAKCKFTVDEANAVATAKISVAGAVSEAEKKKSEALNIALKKEIASRPNIVLWTGIGAAAGIGITVLIVMAIGGATKL